MTETVLPDDVIAPVRCSDDERERTCSALHVAAGEGRLSLTEVEERIAEVYSARYRHELDALTADLPAADEPATGWQAIALSAWRQLNADVAALLGRGAEMTTRRRLVIASILALFMVSALVAAFHGFADDGLEHHGIDHG